MEESILYIYLANRPTSGYGNRKNGMYRSWFDHWTICFAIVDARLLVKTFATSRALKRSIDPSA
jgi:hypothetical protein